jgi:hypothetical protein
VYLTLKIIFCVVWKLDFRANQLDPRCKFPVRSLPPRNSLEGHEGGSLKSLDYLGMVLWDATFQMHLCNVRAKTWSMEVLLWTSLISNHCSVIPSPKLSMKLTH